MTTGEQIPAFVGSAGVLLASRGSGRGCASGQSVEDPTRPAWERGAGEKGQNVKS